MLDHGFRLGERIFLGLLFFLNGKDGVQALVFRIEHFIFSLMSYSSAMHYTLYHRLFVS